MIGINIPLPKRCIDCPCSYWIQSGDYEGMLMCQAIEYTLPINGLDRTGECIVDEWADKRPNDCPMFELIIPNESNKMTL